jgi:hypothetical protein
MLCTVFCLSVVHLVTLYNPVYIQREVSTLAKVLIRFGLVRYGTCRWRLCVTPKHLKSALHCFVSQKEDEQ